MIASLSLFFLENYVDRTAVDRFETSLCCGCSGAAPSSGREYVTEFSAHPPVVRRSCVCNQGAPQSCLIPFFIGRGEALTETSAIPAEQLALMQRICQPSFLRVVTLYMVMLSGIADVAYASPIFTLELLAVQLGFVWFLGGQNICI